MASNNERIRLLQEMQSLCLRDSISKLEKMAKEKVMSASSSAAMQVQLTAALEEKRAKMASSRQRVSHFGEGQSVAARGGGGTRNAGTQTEDPAEAVDAEIARLKARRDELVAATRNKPKNAGNMVELLKKRNAVLLAREERILQRLRTERQEKEERVRLLQHEF